MHAAQRRARLRLRHSNGKLYGPWRAKGSPGQGGVPNAYWTVSPNAVVPAGTYTIVDSSPATWSQNRQSGGRGFAVVKGYPAGDAGTEPPSAERMRISVTYKNESGQTVHMFATGEKFSADNKLSPGGYRTASGEGKKLPQITIYAGVNGKVLHSIKINVRDGGSYTVVFGANKRLKLVN